MATNSKKKFKKKRNFSRKPEGKAKKFMDDFKEYSSDDETNDPSWYAQYPELMKDSASLPYSIPTGGKISWDLSVDTVNYPLSDRGSIDQDAFHSVPGIMTFGIVPTPGLSLDATSPVNVAADMLYTKVRAENSGARNYDSPDLILYCLAMDQIYSLITWFNRIYGTMMLYSQVNRYLPKALLRAQHVDPDDMLLHINDFKAFLDTATAQAAVFSVPNDIKLFNRHAFMYQNVYKDAESAKSQLYQYAPRVFYAYDELNGPGKLKPIDVIYTYPNGLGFMDLVDLFHKLMDPIIAAEDFNIMSGDILKAFGEGSLLKLQLMPSGYTIVPITDYEVLTQMKNASVAKVMMAAALVWSSTTPGVADEWYIHQDANADYIEWNPRMIIGGQITHNITRDQYLTTYKTSPEPADNMVYTRLMYALNEVDVTTDPNDPKYDMYFAAVGSEFVSGVAVTTFYYDANGDWKFGNLLLEPMCQATLTGINESTRLARLMMLKHFDFAPAMYIFLQAASKSYFFPFFDVDNWTIVHAYELEKMHRTALMSMLRVPMIGSALPSNMGRIK